MKPETVTIISLDRESKVSKRTNKPYESLSINTKEHGWISGFGGKGNERWKEGDIVNVIIKKEKAYTNFEMPQSEGGARNNSSTVALLEKISNQLAVIVTHLGMNKPNGAGGGGASDTISNTSTRPHYPTPEEEGINTDEGF